LREDGVGNSGAAGIGAPVRETRAVAIAIFPGIRTSPIRISKAGTVIFIVSEALTCAVIVIPIRWPVGA
jgi:hypothetical protein